MLFRSCLAPQNAFYLLQGLETLPLRVARHGENARKVIEFLKANAAVEGIASPELPDHPDHALARRLLPRGTGSIFSFDIKGGREPCSDALFARRRALLARSAHPLVLLPGDNEWTDCHRPSAGAFDPLERLAALRRRFFAPGRSLGAEIGRAHV